MTVLRVIDFETTGMEPPAEVVEVGYCDLRLDPHGGWIVDEPVSWLCAASQVPPECRAVHHISAADLVGMPPFDAARLVEDSDHCAVIAAHNTAHILKALFAAGATGKEMVAWTKEPRLLPSCPIGKFRGKPWAEVESGFLNWMMGVADMDPDLKWNARHELDRRHAAA